MNDWFKERGIGQEQVAATLNVSVSTVSRIVNYKRDLSMRRAMILHTEYGIPFDVMYPSQLSEGEGVFVRQGNARSRFGTSEPGVCNTSNVGRFPVAKLRIVRIAF